MQRRADAQPDSHLDADDICAQLAERRTEVLIVASEHGNPRCVCGEAAIVENPGKPRRLEYEARSSKPMLES